MKYPILGICLSSALAASTVLAGNLVRNGAFTATLAPWETEGAGSRVPDDGHASGPGCAELVSSPSAPSTAAIWQTMAVVPGARYRASIALRTTAGGGPASSGWAAVAWTDGSDRPIRLDTFAEVPPDTDWTSFQAAMTAPGNAFYAVVYVGRPGVSGDDGALRVDDAAFVELALPSDPASMISAPPDGGTLHCVDLASGERSRCASASWLPPADDAPASVAGMAWWDDRLIVAEPAGEIFVVEPADGFAERLGPTGLSDIRGLAQDPISGDLLTVTGGAVPSIAAIDPATLETRGVGPARALVRDVAFDPYGRLWGVDVIIPGRLVSIDDPGETIETDMTGLAAIEFSSVTGALYAHNEDDGHIHLVDPVTGKTSSLGPADAAGESVAIRLPRPGHSVGERWEERDAVVGGLGTIIRADSDACLTGFSQGWTFSEPQMVRFAVYEEDPESSQFRRIALSKALTRGPGSGLWPSGPMMSPLRAGRRYALMTFHAGPARYHSSAPPWGAFPFARPLAGASYADSDTPPTQLTPIEHPTGILRTTVRTDLPGSVWLYVDCETMEPEQPVGTDGAYAGEPEGLLDGTAGVEDNPEMGRCLRIRGRKYPWQHASGGPWFQPYGNRRIPVGRVVVEFDVYRETGEEFQAWINESGFWGQIARLYLDAGSACYMGSTSYSYQYIGSYEVGARIHPRLVCDLDRGCCSIYLDGECRLRDEPFDDPVQGVSALVFLSLDDRDEMTGACIDNILVFVAHEDDLDGDGVPDHARFTSANHAADGVALTFLADGACSAYQLLGADTPDNALWTVVDQQPAAGASGVFRLPPTELTAPRRVYHVRCLP